MMRRRLAVLLVLGAAVVSAGAGLIAQGTAPGAPSNLTYQANGGLVLLNWISSPGMTPTFEPTSSFYRLEAAYGAGQAAFFTWDSSTRGDPPEARTMFYLLTDFGAGGVAPNTYYVKIRGVNNGIVGPPSNEVAVRVTAGCQVPGAPTDFTGITRGTTVYMGWNDGNGGIPASYVVQARYSSGGPIIASLQTYKLAGNGTEPPQGGYLNVAGVPPGTFYVQVVAANACGTSAPSNEIVVNAPNTEPAGRTPNAASGRLPWFQIRDVVLQVANEARNAGYMDGSRSCPVRPNFDPNDIEARKTQRNAYIDYIVTQLRARFDQRIGYNRKPTRANAIVAGDEISFHYGSDAPEGSPNAYFIDTLGGHCTFGRESVDYRPFFIEYGRWTGAGVF
jgi:hypothetical protein